MNCRAFVGTEEVEHFAQIAVRMEAVSVADEIAFRHDAVDRGTDHQERPVELPAVERDEAGVALEELPELLQDLLLAAGDVGALARLLDRELRLPRHFIHRARSAVFDVDDADGDDAAAKRREPAGAPRLFGVTVVEPLDQVFADVSVELFPGSPDRFDVDDEFFHEGTRRFYPREEGALVTPRLFRSQRTAIASSVQPCRCCRRSCVFAQDGLNEPSSACRTTPSPHPPTSAARRARRRSA